MRHNPVELEPSAGYLGARDFDKGLALVFYLEKGIDLINFLPVTEDDLELIRTWRNQEEVRSYMYTNHIISPEEHRAWFEKISSDPTVKCWIFSEDGIKKTGLVYLYDLDLKNKRAFWGLYIGDLAARGSGIGSRVGFTVLDY